jgi:hypothetical protein
MMQVLIIGEMNKKDLADLKKSGCSVTVEEDTVSGLSKLDKKEFDVAAINRKQDGWLSLREVIHKVESHNVKYTIF